MCNCWIPASENKCSPEELQAARKVATQATYGTPWTIRFVLGPVPLSLS
jgi:hypothetical protein